MRLSYVYDDGGRSAAGFRGKAGDCVARAVAIASGRSYAEVYAALAAGTGAERQGRGRVTGRRCSASARNGIHVRRKWFRDYMLSLGFVWTPTMGIGTGCRVHLADGELPAGRLVVAVSNHYTAVIDGEIRDTHDPRRGALGGVTIYPPSAPRDRVPGAATWLENGNGWAYAPERCVYGYWREVRRV